MNCIIYSQADVKNLQQLLNSISNERGLEYHAFKVGWYNECVQKAFKLPFDEESLALVIISTPVMFDNLVLPYVRDGHDIEIKDPVDASISYHLAEVKQKLGPVYDVEILHDFDLQPTRRPKILVQTAAHVAGAAYYYQRSDVVDDPWGDKKINGVCVHPKYGGWFAMRGVLIFNNLLCPDLEKSLPVDCVPSNDKRIILLEKFNYNWQEWSYRDIIDVELKYSPLQKLYFETKPANRRRLLKDLVII
ncbi:hypothetical protein CHUAL_004743 [Chamberlinius hualienensis]